MNNVTLPEVTVTPRNINLAGAVDKGRRASCNSLGENDGYLKLLVVSSQYTTSIHPLRGPAEII